MGEDELANLSSETDAYLVAQAARAHAQKAEEKAGSLETAINNVKEHSWTKADHDAFWGDAKAAQEKDSRRIRALLTLTAIALVLVIGLWAVVAYNQDQDTNDLDRTLEGLQNAAVTSCERGNVTRENQRTLYRDLRDALADDSPEIAAVMDEALAAMPENTDCAQFAHVVNP